MCCNHSYVIKYTALAGTSVHNYAILHSTLYTVSRKKGATDFFVVTFTNIDGFS